MADTDIPSEDEANVETMNCDGDDEEMPVTTSDTRTQDEDMTEDAARESSAEIPERPSFVVNKFGESEKVVDDEDNKDLLHELENEHAGEDSTQQFDFNVDLPEFHPHAEADSSRPTFRLCMKYICTENFKSYYGKKMLGPFDQRFTAIIGPNGCGKSNTIDALLFVFGFKSAKLRTSKFCALIHDSDNHKDCTKAKVTVHFSFMYTSPNHSEPLPADFDIGRSVTKSDRTQYYLNGARCTVKEVTAKLREHGVDLDHNRFLILQGEVEQISLMKPVSSSTDEGMLDYLEDIIGSNRYKAPIEEMTKIIADLQSELEVADADYHRRKSQLLRLHPEKLKADEFLAKEGESFRLRHILAQLRLHRTKELVEEYVMEEETVKGKITESHVRLTDMRGQRDSWVSGQEEILKDIRRLKKKADNAAAECVEFEKKKAVAEAEIKNRNTMLKRLKNEAKKAKETKIGLQEKHTTDSAEKARLEELLPGLEEKVSEYMAQFTAAQNEVASATKELQMKKRKLESDKAVVVKEQQEVNRRLDSKNIELNSAREGIIRAEKRVQDLQTKLTDAQQHTTNLIAQQTGDVARVQEMKTETQNFSAKLNDLTARKGQIEGPLRAKNERLNALKELQRTASVANTRDTAIQELMRCKANGTIPGVYGRVGDLGAVEKQYEIAVSAVAGTGLDRVVVDTKETSKKCIDHLKRIGRGHVNLIVLDEIRRNHLLQSMNSRGNYAEGLPRLFDLVTLEDDDLRPIFYYTLRDTLLARDMDQCSRVGKQTRAVTRIGEIVSPEGTFTGGGDPGSGVEVRIGRNVVSRSSATTASSQAEIASLEETVGRTKGELEEIKRSHEVISQKLTDLRREEAGLTRRMALASGDLATYQKLIDTVPAELKIARNQLQEVQVTSAEEDRLTEELKQLRASLDKVTQKVDGLSAKIADVDKEIWGVREQKVCDSEKKWNKARQKRDDVVRQLNQLTAEMAGGEGALAGNDANVKRKLDQIEDIRQKLADLSAKQEDLEKELEKSTEAAAKATEDLEAVQSSVSDFQERLGKMEEEIERLETDTAGFEARLNEVKKSRKASELDLVELGKKPHAIPTECDARKYAKPVAFEDLDSEALAQLDYEETTDRARELKSWIEKAKVKLDVLPEYETVRKEYDVQSKEYRTLKAKFSSASNLLKKLSEQRTEEFVTSFAVIQEKLKKTYNFLTYGGDAELVPVNNVNIFGDGIEFSVRPPNKSWKSITNLSGGEKTLSSLSLIFALHHYKPTPFYIMDEIDAALDYRNVTIVGKYVKDRALDAQFVIISLRPNMYQQASRHIGIFKDANVTQVTAMLSDAFTPGLSENTKKGHDQSELNEANGEEMKKAAGQRFLRAMLLRCQEMAKRTG